MKNIFYLCLITFLITACSNDEHSENQNKEIVSSDTTLQICDDPGTILDTLDYPSEVLNWIVIQNKTLNESRATDDIVWMSLPSESDMTDSNSNNDDISFVVQLPANIYIKKVVIREVDTTTSDCLNNQFIFDLELGYKQSKLSPSVESFSYTLTQSHWGKYEFFTVYTSDNGGRKKKVVAANPTTHPEPAY
ncbi:MAG: hypothetical protein GQ574_06125 [Crocinitomix sp.]|nr:hypothetical protein [Crocinitomix sp.]